MLKSRRFLLTMGLLVLIAGFLTFMAISNPGDRINRRSFENLKIGMSLEEVETLLRVSNERRGSGNVVNEGIPEWGELQPPTRADWNRQKEVIVWANDWASIAVGFDKDKKVTNAQFRKTHPRDLSVVDKLRYWFRRD